MGGAPAFANGDIPPARGLDADGWQLGLAFGPCPEGRLKMPNGDRYEGDVGADGQPHGQGRMVAPNGDRHEGAYRRGLAHGWGVLVCANGVRYAGEFRDGEADGHGAMTWPGPHGGRFEGEWRGGKPVPR